jgi:hypothetical protein
MGLLHIHVLLPGRSLIDVSFYTTALPQYMLVEIAHGLNSGVVHVATGKIIHRLRDARADLPGCPADVL